MNEAWIVAADLGNSALKLAALPQQAPLQELPVQRVWLEDAHWPDTIEQSLLRLGLRADQPALWMVASVNRPAYDRLRAWISRHRKHDRLNVVTCRDVPLNADVDEIQRVGIDRLVAAWTAYRLVGSKPVVAVDAGSATTVDYVDEQGIFRGGAIMAGLRLQVRALASGTDALTEFDIGNSPEPPLKPGRSTQPAIRIGVCAAAAGGIRFLVEQYQHLSRAPLSVVLTGGDAAFLQPHLDASVHTVPDLIVRGLAEIAQRQITVTT